MSMKVKGLLVGALLTVSNFALAGTITPTYSEVSVADADASCRAAGGHALGHTMETTTATGTEFYIVACARPFGNQTAYTPAWSAVSFDDARARCETNSVTTGLPAGEPVGNPYYATPTQPDIFIVLCDQ
jgi:hypothetical protein